MNRRTLIKAGVCAASAPNLRLKKPNFAFGQHSGAFRILSPAVATAAQSSSLTFYNKSQKETANGNDIQAIATSIGTLFGNMNETGYNSALSQSIAASSAETSSGSIVTSRSGAVLNELSKARYELTSSQMAAFTNISAAQCQTVLAQETQSGLLNMEGQIQTDFQNAANSTGYALVSLKLRTEKAHILHVDCAVLAVTCDVLAFWSPPGINLIFAGAGIAYGILALSGRC